MNVLGYPIPLVVTNYLTIILQMWIVSMLVLKSLPVVPWVYPISIVRVCVCVCVSVSTCACVCACACVFVRMCVTAWSVSDSFFTTGITPSLSSVMGWKQPWLTNSCTSDVLPNSFRRGTPDLFLWAHLLIICNCFEWLCQALIQAHIYLAIQNVLFRLSAWSAHRKTHLTHYYCYCYDFGLLALISSSIYFLVSGRLRLCWAW